MVENEPTSEAGEPVEPVPADERTSESQAEDSGGAATRPRLTDDQRERIRGILRTELGKAYDRNVYTRGQFPDPDALEAEVDEKKRRMDESRRKPREKPQPGKEDPSAELPAESEGDAPGGGPPSQQ